MDIESKGILNRAIEFRENGSFNDAILLLNDGLVKFPKNLNMLTCLSYCHLLNDDIDNARNLMSKAKDLGIDSALIGWNEARLLLKEKKLAEALAVARITNTQYPDDVVGMVVIGACLRASLEYEESLVFLNKAIDLDINYAEAYINRGLIKLSTNKKIAALSDFEIAFNLKPHIQQIWDIIISLKIEFKQFSEVKLILQRMIKINNSEKLLMFLAFCNKKLGDLVGAINNYKQALMVNPDSAEIYNDMGNAQRKNRELDRAKSSYKQALKINPELPEAYNNLGVILQTQGDTKAAIDSYTAAIKALPNYGEAFLNLANAQQDECDWNAAIESYSQALKINSDDAVAYNYRGVAFQKIGNKKAAMKDFKQAIKINTNYSGAYNNIASALTEIGDYKAALENLNKAIVIEPGSVQAAMNLSRAKGLAVPGWHLPMMNDAHRNKSYFKALESAIQGHELVLDIGTGAGLLSMMASQLGARQIVTCEVSPTISEVAEKIIETNGFSKNITVINKLSTDLVVGEDLPSKADLLVSEILSSEFVGEGVQSSIFDAKRRLLKENGVMIPEGGSIMISLIENTKDIAKKIFVKDFNSFDVSDFNSITQSKFSFFSFDDEPSLLSEPVAAFNFDLKNLSEIKTETRRIILTATQDGVCAGVIQWMKIKLFKDIDYENNPIEIHRSNEPTGWQTPIYRFDQPVEVKAGQVLEINAKLFKDSVWFSKN